MKQIILFLLLFISVITRGQYVTTLEIDHVPNATIKAAVEKNGTALLTEFNNAHSEGRSLIFQNIEIDPAAVTSLNQLWELYPFRSDEEYLIEDCIPTTKGYQVRNIPIRFESLQGVDKPDNECPDIVIDYDKEGKITDVRIALPQHQYQSIMRNNLEISDLRKRSLIVEFAEQLLTAYYKKDIAFLENTFYGEDNSLFSEGLHPGDQKSPTPQTKSEYLTRLKNGCRKYPFLNAALEDLKINQHRIKQNIYGVTIMQSWNYRNYSDGGYFFSVWDFSDEENPKLQVKAWQPSTTPANELWGLPDFNIK